MLLRRTVVVFHGRPSSSFAPLDADAEIRAKRMPDAGFFHASRSTLVFAGKFRENREYVAAASVKPETGGRAIRCQGRVGSLRNWA